MGTDIFVFAEFSTDHHVALFERNQITNINIHLCKHDFFLMQWTVQHLIPLMKKFSL